MTFDTWSHCLCLPRRNKWMNSFLWYTWTSLVIPATSKAPQYHFGPMYTQSSLTLYTNIGYICHGGCVAVFLGSIISLLIAWQGLCTIHVKSKHKNPTYVSPFVNRCLVRWRCLNIRTLPTFHYFLCTLLLFFIFYVLFLRSYPYFASRFSMSTSRIMSGYLELPKIVSWDIPWCITIAFSPSFHNTSISSFNHKRISKFSISCFLGYSTPL